MDILTAAISTNMSLPNLQIQEPTSSQSPPPFDQYGGSYNSQHMQMALSHPKSEAISSHANDHSHPSSEFLPFVSIGMSAPQQAMAKSIDFQHEPQKLFDIASHTIEESMPSSDEKQMQYHHHNGLYHNHNSNSNSNSNGKLPLTTLGNDSESYAHPYPTLLTPLSTSIVAPSLQQNTVSVEVVHSQQNLMQSTKLSLSKHFSNDIEAFNTWMACCDVHDDRIAYYSALYPLLCEIFVSVTKCSRVPQQRELEEVIMKHGATKLSLSKVEKTKRNSKLSYTVMSSTPLPSHHGHHVSDAVSFDFDNPDSKPTHLITITYHAFRKFWKWFKECCLIIKELAHLWDVCDNCVVQCNLFCSREECHDILRQAPQGTFMLRLSSVITSALVLSYAEPSYSKKDRHFKHTILIRRDPHQYVLRSQAKKNGKEKITSISNLVRSFVKIKFLYTPSKLYPKKSIF